jgi:hypothetical protein
MKAFRVDSETSIQPFGDGARDIPVGGLTLREVQDQALGAAGLERVDSPPTEPYICYGSQTWFTPALLRLLMAGEPGRLHVEDEAFWETTGPLQEVSEPGVYALALHPGGSAPMDSLPLRTVDLGLRDFEVPPMHPQMAHAMRPVRVGAAMVHQVDHWTHIVRINQLALAAEAEAAWARWEKAGFLQRSWTLGWLLWRSRGWQRDRILRSLSEVHSSARVHSTAVIEASRLGPGVVVGPMAVVKNSVLAANVHVEEHATVVMSSLGEGSHVGRYGMVNLCTAWPGARISSGNGYQCCVFGRDSFVAWGATVLDLSFGKEVRVLHKGQWVGSGHHFMGGAIGHRACLGSGVRVNHGMEIPNESVVVAGGDDLLRRRSAEAPDETLFRVVDGELEPLKKG